MSVRNLNVKLIVCDVFAFLRENITVCKHWTLRLHRYPTMQCISNNKNNIADTGGQ